MAVTSQTPINVTEANGLTTVFPYNFLVLDATDLLVRVAGVTKTLNVDYTVSGVGNQGGGNVTFTVAPAFGLTVVRQRVMPYDREQDYQTNGDFAAVEVNADFDRPVMMIQQLAESISRALVLPPELSGIPTALPGPESLRGLRWNALANGLENYTISDFTHPDGAANVGYTPAGPSVFRTVQDKLREFVSVKDFGARGDGVTNDTAAFQAAIAHLSANATVRGGTLYVPAGRYILTDTLTFNSYVTDNAINIAFKGDGWLSTWLDFSTMTGNKDAVIVPNDQQFTMEGFYVRGGAGARDGVRLGTTGANAVSVFVLRDIRVQGFSRDGFTHYNSYMGTMERCYAISNGRDGFRFDGFHTSICGINCYARANVGAGFRINGMVYSSFMSCGSDVNDVGFDVSNVRGLAFVGCGTEGNNKDGWLLRAEAGLVDTANPLFVSECYDIRGCTLQNCSGYGNNIANSTFAGLARLRANGIHTGAGSYGDSRARRVEVAIYGCDANVSVAGTEAVVTEAVSSGVVDFVEDRNFFPGGYTIGAGTIRKNESVRGKVCLTTTVAQTVPNATLTAVTLNTTPTKNDLGATVGSTTITIPAGVSKVRVAANIGWASNSTGYRTLVIRRNNAGGIGLPQSTYVPNGLAQHNVQTAIIDVVAGDTISVWVEQSSGGGTLDTLAGGNSAWVSVEAIS